MSDGPFVLDASAVLCLLFEEPGAEHVEARLDGALLSTVNYHEVQTKLIDRGVPAADVRALLAQLDIELVPHDRAQADLGAALREATRKAGLSLGDRSCLALAKLRDGTAITADRAWAELDIGVTVELIRL